MLDEVRRINSAGCGKSEEITMEGTGTSKNISRFYCLTFFFILPQSISQIAFLIFNPFKFECDRISIFGSLDSIEGRDQELNIVMNTSGLTSKQLYDQHREKRDLLHF